MASKKTVALALFLMVNLLFLNLAAACGGKCPPSPKPKPKPKSCPKDALKLGVCADVLGSLLNLTIGNPPKEPCCSLIENLVDLEAAVCLCTAIKLGVLGIKLDIPLSLVLLLNYCGKTVPSGFVCA